MITAEQLKLRGQKISEAKIRHGMSHTKTHNAWVRMKQRCDNKNDSRYEAYGGRGISVCKRWYVFENFLADMGMAATGMSLDRINNDGNYEPSNCRWATNKTQTNNTSKNVRLEFNGEIKTLSQWAEELEIKVGTIWLRLKRGWTVERALTKYDFRIRN